MDEIFKLDLEGFNETISKCRELANKMRDLTYELDCVSTELMNHWLGEGGTAFKKKYSVMTMLLKDLKEDLYDMADSIQDAEESYIQADVDLAKKTEGKSAPGEGKV